MAVQKANSKYRQKEPPAIAEGSNNFITCGNLLDTVFLFETIHASTSINKLLLTCEERVASGTNLYTQRFFH
jgi:hypothetical protein